MSMNVSRTCAALALLSAVGLVAPALAQVNPPPVPSADIASPPPVPGAAGVSGPPPLNPAQPTPPPIPQIEIYVEQNGQPAGPFTPSQIGQMAASGQVSATTRAWTQGMADWAPVSTLPALAGVLPQTPPGPGGTPGGAGAGGFGGNAGGFGGQGGQGGGASPLDAMAAEERKDMGVPAPRTLHSGPMHGATPASIPGGQLITTKGLSEMIQRQMPYILFDVLGSGEYLPGAQNAVAASQAGSFQDQTQQRFGQYLSQVTQGRKDVALVFYCASVECWMSYNAALRAINLGYTNVLWYRGGLKSWKAAGFPTQRAGMQQTQ